MLLLDIDGVLSPDAAPATPAGFVEHALGEYQVRIAQQHGEWLRSLLGEFDLVWATSWEDDANRLISPLLGLPRLPFIEFTEGRAIGTWKLPCVVRFVGNRPCAWVDDELDSDADDWARAREIPTLLVRADPSQGLTRRQITALRRFAARVSESHDEG